MKKTDKGKSVSGKLPGWFHRLNIVLFLVMVATAPVFASLSVEAKPEQQVERRAIKGKIVDEKGAPLPGVTITVVGTTRGVITDIDGSYTIEASPNDKLVFSFIGMESQIVDVGNQTNINITMTEKRELLDDVTVVAFARQKKESVLASIETVKPEELRIPASNLTTALAGRMSGVISYQRSGEPGQDNAEFSAIWLFVTFKLPYFITFILQINF